MKKQGGQVLLILAAILLLGVSWALLGALGKASMSTASQRAQNARALADAKAALIGWVATNALDSSEQNPGRLPCPQNWGDIGSTNEGRAGTCGTPAVGWLPWRTLGLPKLVDASGNQLWYVISPGWYVPSSPAGTTLTLNSNTAGQLMVDGSAAVALIIAPGSALNISPDANQTAAGCTARSQAQNLDMLPGSGPNVLDFLDCQNGTTSDNVFTSSVVDNATNPVFNDQVLAITTADVLPAIEAAIAHRIEQQIVPVLGTIYADPAWGTSSTNPAFPFPAAFSDPTTSTYQGQTGCASTSPSLCQGLFPFNYHSATCGADPRCSSDTIVWSSPSLTSTGGSGSFSGAPSCGLSGSAPTCQGGYTGGTLNITITNAAADITKGLRTFATANHIAVAWWWCCYNWSTGLWQGPYPLTPTTSRTLAADGSVNFKAAITLPSPGATGYYYIQESRPSFSDHAILSSTDPTTGWFVRNEWYRLLYYAIAYPHAPGGTLSCTAGTTCLQVTNLTDPTKQRAVLALTGRALTTLNQSRPSSSLQNYLDSTENQNLDFVFAQSGVGRTFNDRFISLSKLP